MYVELWFRHIALGGLEESKEEKCRFYYMIWRPTVSMGLGDTEESEEEDSGDVGRGLD